MKNINYILNLIPFTDYFKIVFVHFLILLLFINQISYISIIIGLIWGVIVWISFDISFHRMWSHKALTCSKIMECIFCSINIFAGMKSAIDFCGPHIWHHKYSDTEKDTYWPKGIPIWKIFVQHKSIYQNINKIEMLRMCKHLLKNKIIKFFNNYFYLMFFSLHILIFLTNPSLIIPLISIPVVFAYMINIPGGVLLQHKWGVRICNDSSVNNKLLSYITLGLLCQHSNHHYAPGSYTFDIDKDSFDLIGVSIEMLNKINLVSIHNTNHKQHAFD